MAILVKIQKLVLGTNLNPYKFLYPYDPMNLDPKYAIFCVQLVHTHAVLLT